MPARHVIVARRFEQSQILEADTSRQFHFFRIDYLSDIRARVDLVTWRYPADHSTEKHSAGCPLVFSRATSPSIGAVTRILSMFCCAWAIASLALFRFFLQGDGRAPRGASRLHILIQFSHDAFRAVQSKVVFPGVNRANQFVFLNVHSARRTSKRAFSRATLSCARDFRIRLRLGNFLLGL